MNKKTDKGFVRAEVVFLLLFSMVLINIAIDFLDITLSTVKTHIGSLMAKLGARNRVEVAMWGYETGRARE